MVFRVLTWADLINAERINNGLKGLKNRKLFLPPEGEFRNCLFQTLHHPAVAIDAGQR